MATTGSPAVSLYTNRTVSDPAALSVAILSSAGAAGQTSAQPSAPLVVTGQPLPNLPSVPVSLNLTTQEASLRAMRQTSPNPLQPVLAASQPASNLTANSQETLSLQTLLEAAVGPPASTTEDNKPVTSSALRSLPQVGLTPCVHS